MTTPFGDSYVGVKITIGGVTDPATIKRTYDDIDRIMKSDPTKYKTVEEHNPDGTFKSLHIETP